MNLPVLDKSAALSDYFGFREQPFGVTPDPRYLYLSPSHREALTSLEYGIETNCGFLALIAPPGMGKTTILFHLLTKLDRSARTAFLFQNRCTAREFMRLLLAELGVETDTHDFPRMYALFSRCLLQEAKAGRSFIIIVDEAQDLDPSVLETIRLLSNFETPRFKLLRIILAGQPGLADKLLRPSLSQLTQRIALISGLSPLTEEDTSGLITHRLHVAGYDGAPLFSSDAQSLIAELAEGIPRQVNKYCFHALRLAYQDGKHTIDSGIVQAVANQLDISRFVSRTGVDNTDNLIRAVDSNSSSCRASYESTKGSSVSTDTKNTCNETVSSGLSTDEALQYMRNLVRRVHRRNDG